LRHSLFRAVYLNIINETPQFVGSDRLRCGQAAKKFDAPLSLTGFLAGNPNPWHAGLKIALYAGHKRFMTLDQAAKQIRRCSQKMNDLYGRVVFDEWVVISLAQHRARILFYVGPRNDDFLKNFATDLGSLRAELMNSSYNVGDFEFSRSGVGTGFEAFVVLGDGIYLICNNTEASMEDITKDPKWLNAQVPFAELSDSIRPDPLTVAGDNTNFFARN
jgi:hypothetical protein